MPKSFTLDGKRRPLPEAVPTQQIEWIVSRLHVGTTDQEVRDEIARRANGNGGWAVPLIRAAADYAVYCHRRNQKLYRFAMTGSR